MKEKELMYTLPFTMVNPRLPNLVCSKFKVEKMKSYADIFFNVSVSIHRG